MNAAIFVSFSSTEDLDGVPEGTIFEPTWRMRNVGTTTWNNDYKVRIVNVDSGSKLMAARPEFKLGDVADKAQRCTGRRSQHHHPYGSVAAAQRAAIHRLAL